MLHAAEHGQRDQFAVRGRCLRELGIWLGDRMQRLGRTRPVVELSVFSTDATNVLHVQEDEVVPAAARHLRSQGEGTHNDGIYGQYHQRRTRSEQARRYRCHLDVWLADVMGIEGIPIPYGAPNANPHVERFNRTLREEALNHFIFLNVQHILDVCREYVEFYNRARPSQALHAIPQPYPELSKPPPTNGKLIALPVLGGVQHDYRLAA